jgi:hypothetical protein
VSFAAVTLCVASQRVTPKVSVYFVIVSVRKFWIHTRIPNFIKIRYVVLQMKQKEGRTDMTSQLCVHFIPLEQRTQKTLTNVDPAQGIQIGRPSVSVALDHISKWSKKLPCSLKERAHKLEA